MSVAAVMVFRSSTERKGQTGKVSKADDHSKAPQNPPSVLVNQISKPDSEIIEAATISPEACGAIGTSVETTDLTGSKTKSNRERKHGKKSCDVEAMGKNCNQNRSKPVADLQTTETLLKTEHSKKTLSQQGSPATTQNEGIMCKAYERLIDIIASAIKSLITCGGVASYICK